MARIIVEAEDININFNVDGLDSSDFLEVINRVMLALGYSPDSIEDGFRYMVFEHYDGSDIVKAIETDLEYERELDSEDEETNDDQSRMDEEQIAELHRRMSEAIRKTKDTNKGCSVCGIGEKGEVMGYACMNPKCPSGVIYNSPCIGTSDPNITVRYSTNSGCGGNCNCQK